MAKTGSWGGNAVDTWFNKPVSIGLTLGTQEYPNGKISVNISSSASPAKAWQRRDSNNNRKIDFYLCDSAGNNTILLWRVQGFTSQGKFIYTPTATTITNTSKKLMGTALYVKGIGVGTGTGDSSYVGTYGAITMTINTSTSTFKVTTAVSPSGSGSVSGGGNKTYETKVQLTATANSGYTFSSWSKTGGTLSSTSTNPTTYTVPASNQTVTANFSTNSYTLTVSKGTGISSVSGGGTVAYGGKKQITATASTGYSFKNWTSNNGGSFSNANAATTTFTMPAGNVTATANGVINTYTLTVAKGTGVASVTGGGNVNYNSSNAISATMSTGYSFKNWTSNNGGSFNNANSASTSFTMPAGNVTVTANGQINSYSLSTTVSPSGGGTVTAGATMNYNTQKQLVATASSGYTFSSWTKTAGTLSSTSAATTTFTMGTSNSTVTANFTINTYTLTTAASPAAGGSVTQGSQMVYNTKKQLVATANTGYSFSSWTKTAGTLSTTSAATTTFTMGAGNATVTANFTHNTYTLGKAANPTAGGSVTLSAASGYYNDKIKCTATANTGYSFSSWTKTGGTLSSTTTNPTTYTVPTSNQTVTANFTHNLYTVSKASNPSAGGGVTLGATSGYYNDKIQIVASTNTGYTFSSWSVSGGSVNSSSATTTTFTLPASNSTVTANFTHNTYSVSSAVTPASSGSVTLSKTVAYYADTVTITATPAAGWRFVSWSKTGGTIANTASASTTLTMPTANVTVTATFEPDIVTLTSAAAPSEGGTVTSLSGTYTCGSKIQLVATPSSGYRFYGWKATAGTFTDALATTTTYTVPLVNAAIYGDFGLTTSYTKSGRYNGSSYDAVIPMYYNGTSWVECEVKRYNGSNWDTVVTM